MSRLVPDYYSIGLDAFGQHLDADVMYSSGYDGTPYKLTDISANRPLRPLRIMPVHISFDGLNSGVPTRTTPTLTPTTLRNIEQTFIELQCPDNSERHSNEARFVPPSVKATGNNQYTTNLDPPTPINNNNNTNTFGSLPSSILNNIAPINVNTDAANIYTTTAHNMNKSVTHWQHVTHISPPGPSSISQDCNSSDSGSSYGTMRPTPPVTPHRQPMMTPTTLDDAASAGDTMTSPPPPCYNQSTTVPGTGRGRGGARRNVGGRKPQREANLSPEEEQRRQLRRERNKAAAARCRKRRVDHTNMLVEEVEGHESKKRELHAELQNMRLVKDELEMILAHHQKDGSLCKGAHIQSSVSRCNAALRQHLTNGTTPPLTDIKTSCYNTNNNINLLPAAIKTEYDDYNDTTMDYDDDDDDDDIDDYTSSDEHNDRDLFPAPSSKRIMLTHASLPPVVMRPNRPNSLNVLANPSTTAMAKTSNCGGGGMADSLPGMNSTPSSGLQFNFDSLMVGGTGLTPVAGPLLPTSLHCGSHQQQQLRLCTSGGGGMNVAASLADMMLGGGNIELNTPDVSHKMMLSL